MLSGIAPVLVTVAFNVIGIPLFTPPKLMFVIVAVWITPVPVKLELSTPAPLLTVSVPLLAPATAGANFTVTKHVPVTGSVAGHVVLW